MAFRKLGAAPDLAPTPSSGGVTAINVPPLIDVLLVLLITGLISAGLARKSLPVDLPETIPQPVLTTPIVLELANDGGYRLNGQVIPGRQLTDQLTSVFRSRPVKILFIKTGSKRTYQEFIQAADVARGSGVVTIAAVGN